jgi:sRNA-binding regulator protein Hfq
MATARRPNSGGEGPLPPADPSGPELGPRKLIRPALADLRKDHGLPRSPSSRKSVPPEQTNAEAFYYLKQMQSRTQIVVRLLDGEELRGWIEWYDKDVIKLNRENAPNLVVPKHSIKYLYKEEEERQFRRRKPRPDSRTPEGTPAGRPPL